MKLFDLHCDTLYECCETGRRLRENDLHVNRAAARKYRHYAQFFALFCGARAPSETLARERDCLLRHAGGPPPGTYAGNRAARVRG